MRNILVLSMFIVLFGCGRPCQEVAATQCYENAIYVCNSNKQWEFIQKCKMVSSCRHDGVLAYCAKDTNQKEYIETGDNK